MNLYTGKADWMWVEPHLGGKWSKTGQRQGEEILSGALLFKPQRHTHASVHTHTPLHTYMLVTPGRSLFMAVAFAKTEVQFNCAYAHFKGETLASARVGG